MSTDYAGYWLDTTYYEVPYVPLRFRTLLAWQITNEYDVINRFSQLRTLFYGTLELYCRIGILLAEAGWKWKISLTSISSTGVT